MIPRKLQCKYGTVTYRLPNAPEAMILLGRIGLKLEMQTDEETGEQILDEEGNPIMQDAEAAADSMQKGQSMLEMAGKVMLNLEPFILSVDLTLEDKPIRTVKGLLAHMEFVDPLMRISSEILEAVSITAKKKPT